MGLTVVLNIEGNMYKASSRPYIGASIMVHDPIDFPDIGTRTVSALPGHVLVISVSGTSIKSMESLRYLPLEKRLCYFDEEVNKPDFDSLSHCKNIYDTRYLCIGVG